MLSITGHCFTSRAIHAIKVDIAQPDVGVTFDELACYQSNEIKPTIKPQHKRHALSRQMSWHKIHDNQTVKEMSPVELM